MASAAIPGDYVSHMIEVTVRDGRAGRDRAEDSAEGGAVLATLQRDQPYEIGDVITLANGDAVVVIGDREQILPGESWKQTVFVGELTRPHPRFTINLGSCPDWTLQSAGATTTFVRCVDADETARIIAAAGFCRKYATMPTYRLLSSSFRVWQQTFDRVANAKKGEWHSALTEDLLGAFVGWILIWRLVFDQAEHDLSSRFGSASDQLTKFRSARKAAYDASRAYRVVEALRNLVQHREMPSLVLNRISELDQTTGQPTTKVSYKFPVSDLLNWPKCPATVKNEFRGNPDVELELPDIINQAMIAINPVLFELAKISAPELINHVGLLRRVFIEASGAPLLLRVKPPLAGSRLIGSNVEMVPLHDLQFIIQNAPIPDATVNKNADQ
jgi:hypothetical protein